MSRYNEGWWDNEGDACEAAIDAANAGMLFFTSSGNRAQQHWKGFHAGSNDWHDWSGGDELLQIQMAAGASINFYLDWNDDASGIDDYDLYIFDSIGEVVLASSTSDFEFSEELTFANNGPAMMTINVAVERWSGSGTEFELFGHASGGATTWEYFTTASSATSPSNTTNANVISVGAVDQLVYGTTGAIETYSSQGPTNSGNRAPNIVAPTDTNTLAYAGAFGGTSCATPNAAGVALCLWSDAPQYSASAIRWLLLRHGQVFNDWGAGGGDNVYGEGGIALSHFEAGGTIWLSPEYGNFNNLPSAPAATYNAARSQASGGGRVLAFPGGTHAAQGVTSDEILIDASGGIAIFQ